MLQLPSKPRNRKHVEIKAISETLQATTSSRKIAAKFGKEHKNIIAVVENKMKNLTKEFNERSIKLVKYIDKKGEKRKEYILNHDAFMLVIMGFRQNSKKGKKVIDIVKMQEWYVTQFRLMAEYIKENEFYRISVDTRNRMISALKKSGLPDIYGDEVYREIAMLLNKMVFDTNSYPKYLKTITENKGYTSIRDMIRNELDAEEKKMKFLEDFLYNAFSKYNGNLSIGEANGLFEKLDSMKLLLELF